MSYVSLNTPETRYGSPRSSSSSHPTREDRAVRSKACKRNHSELAGEGDNEERDGWITMFGITSRWWFSTCHDSFRACICFMMFFFFFLWDSQPSTNQPSWPLFIGLAFSTPQLIETRKKAPDAKHPDFRKVLMLNSNIKRTTWLYRYTQQVPMPG